MTVYVVGMDGDEQGWQVIGIFTTEEDADAACRTRAHWLAPVTLDLDLGDEPMDWPGVRYPRSSDRGGWMAS